MYINFPSQIAAPERPGVRPPSPQNTTREAHHANQCRGEALSETIEIASRDRRTLFMFGCACHYRSSKAPQTSASLCLNLDRRAGVQRHRTILKKFCMCNPRFAGVRGKSWRTGRVLEGGRRQGSVLGPAGEVLDAPWGSLGSVPGSREAHLPS